MESTPEDVPPSSRSGRPTFLVVEDEEIAVRAMRVLLAPHGRIVFAATARDAARLIGSRAEWGAFFIDLGLPDGSGLDVLARARPDHPTTPAMILTGALDANAINTAFDLDADYVVKPVRKARIVHFLTDHASFPARLRDAVARWRAHYALSDAEADVLLRAALGRPREAIAEARGCSPATIRTHITNLLKKMGDEALHMAVARLLRDVGIRCTTPVFLTRERARMLGG